MFSFILYFNLYFVLFYVFNKLGFFFYYILFPKKLSQQNTLLFSKLFHPGLYFYLLDTLGSFPRQHNYTWVKSTSPLLTPWKHWLCPKRTSFTSPNYLLLYLPTILTQFTLDLYTFFTVLSILFLSKWTNHLNILP